MERSAELCQQLRALRKPHRASLLIRVDFTDDGTWERVRDAVTAPVPQPGGADFRADLQVVDDDRFAGLEPDVLVEGNQDWSLGSVAFLVDRSALRSPYPVLAVDLRTGVTVRVHPPDVWLIENNVSGGADFAVLIEDRVVDNVFEPNAGQPPPAELILKAEPQPPSTQQRMQVAMAEARKQLQGNRRRVVLRMAASGTEAHKQREGSVGDTELERVAEIVPGIEQLNELDAPLIKALLKLPPEEQQRIAFWSRDKAVEHAGIAEDPDIVAAMAEPRATYSSKSLAKKFTNDRSPDEPGAFTSTSSAYPQPRNAAMAAVWTLPAAVFPVPEISMIRTLDAACTTFGPQATELIQQLKERFDLQL